MIGRKIDLFAHIRQKDDAKHDTPHFLTDHLLNTAKLCESNCTSFGLSNVGNIIGLVHDIGKASEAFQARIRTITGYDAHLEGKSPGHVDHSTAAAQFLIKKYDYIPAILLAYIVAGHHGGLPDGKGESYSVLSKRLKRQVEPYSKIHPFLESILTKKLFETDFIPKKFNPNKKIIIYFMVKLLYSALVDADFLDTESYMQKELSFLRTKKIPDIRILSKHFDKYLQTLKQKKQTKLNTIRNSILEWCLEASKIKPGIFSLTVPTGGGKTISSLAFALKHATEHNLRRIIYVIPYTSIIEQNAQIFRNIFSALDGNIVLEHHSNVTQKVETPYNRLSSQNWNSPIIVTTNVQFFDSFYSNRSSYSRKLHNIVDSVIIFDEAQILPREYLSPCLKIISELTNHYGCSAVICTATQPSLNKSKQLKHGLEGVTEIIPDPDQLYKSLKRVKISVKPNKYSISDTVKSLINYKQVLCIVNTRKEARQIFQQLINLVDKNECYHLSTMMCPYHRRATLKSIRDSLNDNLNCKVISTQLVEAGVDIDFPNVFRAIAGLDSIAQAAGRCNRENKLEYGQVIVFEGETLPPPGHLRQSAQSGSYAIKTYPDDPLSPEAIHLYFQDYYSKDSSNKYDKNDIIDLICRNPDAIPFKTISKKFNLLDTELYPIIVPYQTNGMMVIERLRSCKFRGFVDPDLKKELQHYMVQLFEKTIFNLINAGVVEDIFGDGQYLVLINPDIYDEKIGLNPETPHFIKTESMII